VEVLRTRFQHDRSNAVPRSHQTVGFQLGVGGADGIDIDAELASDIAHGWEVIAGLELAVGNEQSDPGADLSGKPDVQAWIELQS
jgi:hypothetical protein